MEGRRKLHNCPEIYEIDNVGKGPTTRGLRDHEPDKAGQILFYCIANQNTKQAENQSGMLNKKMHRT